MTPAEQHARLQQRERITETAISFWEEHNRRFANLCLREVRAAILEDQRTMAIEAYAAMLDAISTERGALSAIHAANGAAPDKAARKKPKEGA